MKKNNVNYQLLTPEEFQKKLDNGFFVVATASNTLSRLRAMAILQRTIKKNYGKDAPEIAFAYNLEHGGEKYVILIAGKKHLDAPAVLLAKNKIAEPWWKFHGVKSFAVDFFAALKKDIVDLIEGQKK